MCEVNAILNLLLTANLAFLAGCFIGLGIRRLRDSHPQRPMVPATASQ